MTSEKKKNIQVWILRMEMIFDELKAPNNRLKPELASRALTPDVEQW